MKHTTPAMLLAASMACAASGTVAAAGCLDDQRTAFGQAIGVLVYDSIVRDYAQFASVEDIANGMKHASDQNRFGLSANTQIVTDPEAAGAAQQKMSLSRAQSIVKQWRSQSGQLGQRFLDEYKRSRLPGKSGLMSHRRVLTIEEQAQFASCASQYDETADKDQKQVCYLQLRIDEEAVCNADVVAKNAIVGSPLDIHYGVFNEDEVIDGWAEAFKLIEKEPLNVTVKEDDSKRQVLEVLELVIPSDLAYGSKGMPGKVQPDETLWFLLAVL